jgi:hypothetical protein
LAVVVNDAAERAGLDPAIFAGHSLRSGFLTSAAKRGASLFKMMDVSRHKSGDTLCGYVRDAELFQDHASGGLLRAGCRFEAASGWAKRGASPRDKPTPEVSLFLILFSGSIISPFGQTMH